MLKTNVIKRTYVITCRMPAGGTAAAAAAAVEAESKLAAVSKGLPRGWMALKVEAVQ